MSHIAQPEASLFIAGRPVEGEGAVLPVLYPYTGEEIASLRDELEEGVEIVFYGPDGQPREATTADQG